MLLKVKTIIFGTFSERMGESFAITDLLKSSDFTCKFRVLSHKVFFYLVYSKFFINSCKIFLKPQGFMLLGVTDHHPVSWLASYCLLASAICLSLRSITLELTRNQLVQCGAHLLHVLQHPYSRSGEQDTVCSITWETKLRDNVAF